MGGVCVGGGWRPPDSHPLGVGGWEGEREGEELASFLSASF